MIHLYEAIVGIKRPPKRNIKNFGDLTEGSFVYLYENNVWKEMRVAYIKKADTPVTSSVITDKTEYRHARIARNVLVRLDYPEDENDADQVEMYLPEDSCWMMSAYGHIVVATGKDSINDIIENSDRVYSAGGRRIDTNRIKKFK